MRRVTVIPGDGIGPDLVAVERRVSDASGAAVAWEEVEASARIARFGFDYARARGLRRITVPHQANILRATDGLFVRTVREVAEAYPDLEVRAEAMDTLCLRMVKRPQDYEVLLTDALYGGILAGLCAGLAGSVGLMPGSNYGPAAAIFEAGHGSAPHYAGQNKANPVGVVLSGALLLEHLGEARAAARVWAAVRTVIGEGRHLTYDLGGKASTAEVAEALVQAVHAH